MTGTSGAFAFLIFRTTRNRIARQLSRLRNPRYAVAAVVGIGYLWLVFARPNPGPPRAGAASPIMGSVAGIGLSITVIIWWLRGAGASALAFLPAEVQLLFPAPVTRRQLLVYRVVRSQILLLLSSIIWTLLSRSWGTGLGAPLRYLTVWGVFSVLGLHRLGAALVQVGPVRGLRWMALMAGRVLAAAAALALAVGIGPAVFQIGNLGWQQGLKAVGAALSVAPAVWALAPVQLVLGPLYTSSPGAWIRAFGLVAGIMALHLVWVLAMNVGFEEVAATASADLAKRIAAFKARRAGGAVVPKGKVGRAWFPLAPVGPPPVAIVWKNTVALVRTGALRTLLLVTVVLVGFSYLMSTTRGGRESSAVAVPFLTIAVMAFVLGPRIMRNDLRQDLLSLASIKTFPVSGAALVAAELASPTLVLSLFQLTMVALAVLSLPSDARALFDRWSLASLVIVMPAVLLALNAANVGIQNAAALLFPGWVRLGSDSGGIEAIGQTLLVTFGSMLVLLLSLVVPFVAGAIAFEVANSALGGFGLAAASALGALVLGGEVVILVRAMGRWFERIDPTALG